MTHEYKVGDKVEVISDTYGYCNKFSKGCILTVASFDEGGVDAYPKGHNPALLHNSEQGCLYYYPAEIKPVEEKLSRKGLSRKTITIGSKVKIRKSAVEYSGILGEAVGWDDGMSAYVGKEAVVVGFYADNLNWIELDVDHEQYAWHRKMLKHLELPKQEN